MIKKETNAAGRLRRRGGDVPALLAAIGLHLFLLLLAPDWRAEKETAPAVTERLEVLLVSPPVSQDVSLPLSDKIAPPPAAVVKTPAAPEAPHANPRPKKREALQQQPTDEPSVATLALEIPAVLVPLAGETASGGENLEGEEARGAIEMDPHPGGSPPAVASSSREAEIPSSGEGAIVEATPLYQENPAPPYPSLARQRRWQGLVMLEVLVSGEGRAQDVRVAASSGHEMLDRAAGTAVAGWLFSPGRRNGAPVAMRVRVPVRFELAAR